MLLSVAHNTICIFSCTSNLFLMHIIIFHTPQAIRSYSVMLITLNIYELLTSLSSFAIFPRIVPLGVEGIVCIYAGPCAYLNSDYSCYLIYTFVLHGFTMYNIQMTANFCFRYYVLKRSDPGVASVVMTNCLLLSPSIICACFFVNAPSPEPLLRELVKEYTPQYDFSQDRLFGVAHLLHSLALPSVFLIVSTALPCTMINVFVGRSIARFLHKHATTFSTKTRTTHHEILKVLTFQAIISQAFLIAVCCYVFGQLNIARSPLQEYATHSIADVCIVFSPILTMYYVQPYRRRVRRLIVHFATFANLRILNETTWMGSPKSITQTREIPVQVLGTSKTKA